MKRRVKKFKRTKQGKTYYYSWIGYQTRNERGTVCFKREVNISSLPAAEIARIDTILKAGDAPLLPSSLFKYHKSTEIGSHWTVLRLCEDLNVYSSLESVLNPTHFAAVMSMITDRVTNPCPMSKLMLSREYPDSGIARILGYRKIPLNEWYMSLDALYRRQEDIEKSLRNNSTNDSKIYMYDITSVYFEGKCCPLAKFGYNRDGKKGKLQIVVGMLTDAEGRPLGIRVFDGNTKDESTVLEQLHRIKEQYNASELIFVGDRGMVTGSIRDHIELIPESGIKYITALKRSEIIKLANDKNHPLQCSLFDRKMVEVEYDSKRYILCFNPLKCDEDKETRRRFLYKTEEKLKNIEKNVASGKYKKEKIIAKKLYTWINKWNMGKCFDVAYSEGKFSYRRNEDKIAELERLDGCYVITTTISESEMSKEEVVKRYKTLTLVEQAFRHMKTTDEFIRPLRHWNANRVKGHVFMCMLAYLVIWESRRCFGEYLERNKDTKMCIAGSLREIWKALDKGISIGTLKKGDEFEDQISPIPNYQKQLLRMANASINQEEKIRLKCC